MAESGLREQVILILEKAQRSLEASRNLLDAGDFDFASSRAYYAAFYALQALLLTKGLTYSKHAGVISAFNEHFVRPELFAKVYSRHISRLFRQRHIGDYDFQMIITRDDGHKDYSLACELVAAVREYLQKENIIN